MAAGVGFSFRGTSALTERVWKNLRRKSLDSLCPTVLPIARPRDITYLRNITGNISYCLNEKFNFEKGKMEEKGVSFEEMQRAQAQVSVFLLFFSLLL